MCDFPAGHGIRVESLIELNFYPWNRWNEYKATIVQAKHETGITEQLKPVQAVPGCGKTIAVEPPPFLTDHALIRSHSVAAFVQALLWYVNDEDTNDRYTSAGKQLSQWMGGHVVEKDNDIEY